MFIYVLFTYLVNIMQHVCPFQNIGTALSAAVSVGDGSVCFKEFKLIQSHCEAGRERRLSQRSRDAEQRLRTAFKV